MKNLTFKLRILLILEQSFKILESRKSPNFVNFHFFFKKCTIKHMKFVENF